MNRKFVKPTSDHKSEKTESFSSRLFDLFSGMAQLPAKRERFDLSLRQKKEICQYKAENPAITQGELAAHFSVEFKGKIGRSTISDILRNKDRWLSASSNDDNAKRFRQGKYPQLEHALFLWLCDAKSKGHVVNDQKLKEKGEMFGDRLGIVDFSYSQGWMANFKRRYGVSQHRISSDSQRVGTSSITYHSVNQLKELIAKYHPDNVYTLYETSLFYHMEPNTALIREAVDTMQWGKDRLTVALVCNTTGGDKCKPIVIGRTARPRSFGDAFVVQKLVDYYSNKKAWMTGTIFEKWLKKFNIEMRSKQKNVLLLVDNTVNHVLEEEILTNVHVQFLEPHKTGIVSSFKIKYRKLHTQYILKSVEGRSESSKLDVKSAIYMIREGWKAVKDTTIQGSWYDTGLSSIDEHNDGRGVIDLQAELKRELRELDRSILQLQYECPLRAAGFIELDRAESFRGDLTEDDIIELVTEDDEDEYYDDDEPSHPPSLSEARIAANTLLRFIECEGSMADESMIGDAYRISCHLDTLSKGQSEQ